MRLERAVRFGFIGAIGLIGIASGTLWLLRVADVPASPTGGAFVYLLVAGFGTAVALMFLFALFDVFVDEKLEAREGADPDE